MLFMFQAFKRRNPERAIRTPERVSKAKATVTEEGIRDWFRVMTDELRDINALEILDDPQRIFNLDESNIQLCPKTGKVVRIKGWRNVYELAPGPEKSTLTFVGTFSASGDIVAPAIIYPYVRVPSDIVNNVPPGFFIGNSESGWMTAPCFFEYIANAFVPFLKTNNVTRPVVLFVDGHSTHSTLQVSEFCEQNDLILYLLPPNTTHILQPANVGPFRPLKHYWAQEVHKFQRENPNSVVRRVDVASHLTKVLKRIKPSSITNGFLATGLYPLYPNKLDYSKCLEIDRENEGNDVVPTIEVSTPVAIAATTSGEQTDSATSRFETALEVVEELFGNDVEDHEKVKLSDLVRKLKDKTHVEIGESSNVSGETASVLSQEDEAITFSIHSSNTFVLEDIENIAICDTEHDLLQFAGETSNTSEDNLTTGTLPFSPQPSTSYGYRGQFSENLMSPLTIEDDDVILENEHADSEITMISASQSIDETPSSSFNRRIFWDGQIKLKKHKPLKERITSMVSSSKYREMLQLKEEKKKKVS